MTSLIMKRTMKAIATVYISEGRNNQMIQSLLNEIPSHQLLHFFQDSIYNRTSFVLKCGDEEGSVGIDHVVTLCLKAMDLINFSDHQGSHPCLGVCDHVCFSPLDDTPIQEVEKAMLFFANSFQESTMEKYQFKFPVFFYSSTNISYASLRGVRKQFGYFEPVASGEYKGYETIQRLESILSQERSPKELIHGIMCCGSVSFVLNVNVSFHQNEPVDKIKQITKRIRTKNVQALTLYRKETNSYEVACNLLFPDVETKEIVINQIRILAHELNLVIDHEYTTTPTKAEYLAKWDNQ